MIKPLFLFAALVGAGQPAETRYAEGQVWEYRTRAGEEAALIRIQRIEPFPGADTAGGKRVYHISIVGLRIGPERRIEALPHAPVARETLDASVTRLAERRAEFPSADEGIGIWRADRGGVFTITLAEIAAAVDMVMSDVRRADVESQE